MFCKRFQSCNIKSIGSSGELCIWIDQARLSFQRGPKRNAAVHLQRLRPAFILVTAFTVLHALMATRDNQPTSQHHNKHLRVLSFPKVQSDSCRWGGADERVCCLASVSWGTHLLKRTFILDAFGSNKYPAVSEGQLLHRWAPELLEQPPSLVVHPVMKVHISDLKIKGNAGADINRVRYSWSHSFWRMPWYSVNWAHCGTLHKV